MKTVLIVDDMAIFRTPIAMVLRNAGFTAVCACNGQEALEIVKANHPDLILLDLGMPIMDGFEFLHALRADPGAQYLPVICLTALSDRNRLIELEKLGADYLLKSSFSMKEMLARIHERLKLPFACGAQMK